MNIRYRSRPFVGIISAALTASLSLSAVSPALAQTDQGNNQTGSEGSGIAPSPPTISIQSISTQISNAPANGALAVDNRTALAALAVIQLQQTGNTQVGAGTSSTEVVATQNALEQEITTTLNQAGGSGVTLASGETVSTTNVSTALTEVIAVLSVAEVANTLSARVGVTELSSSGVPIASSQPVQVVQATGSQSANEAVNLLYTLFQETFTLAGVELDTAGEYAQNLVLALAKLKTWFSSDGDVNLVAINQTTKLMEPILATLPNLLEELDDNPSAREYSLMLDTVTAIRTVAIPLQAINDAV